MLTDGEYAETRACVFEMLGGRVLVRPRVDGSALLRLSLDRGALIKTYKSMRNLVAGQDLILVCGFTHGPTVTDR
jgi:hypothetical protein